MTTAPKPRPIAADPVQVDPKHYKVELENDQVRILRVTYGAREKSVMHGHPASVAVFLTAGRARFAFPDGSTTERPWRAGETMMFMPEEHLPENLTDELIELVLLELKR